MYRCDQFEFHMILSSDFCILLLDLSKWSNSWHHLNFLCLIFLVIYTFNKEILHYNLSYILLEYHVVSFQNVSP